MHSEPEKSSEGLYIVRWETNFLSWLAWKLWLSEEMQKTFFPPTMTVLYPFPPETYERAKLVAEWYNMLRTKIGWGKRVPDNPKPWKRWTPSEMNELDLAEIAYRKAGGTAPGASFGKILPRDGFYRAPREEYLRHDAVRRELPRA